MDKVGKYLKKKREEAGLSLREAAKQVGGISHQHINEIEEGTTSPTFTKVMSLLKSYHADYQDFLRQTGYLPKNVEPVDNSKMRRIPVISWVLAGQWTEAAEHFNPEDAKDWIETDVKGESVFALDVKGDSMEPVFSEGDQIIVRRQAKVNHNDYVVVKNAEGEATLKQIKKAGKKRTLHPLNPKYEDIELSEEQQYIVVGKVVKKQTITSFE